jgi:SAM-dependent methyltransferase
MQQTHQSDPRILGRRTLARDHRRLAPMLLPGMSVLDAGCGTGSITAGIAAAVGSTGQVTGLDRDESLIAIARREHADVANLTFETGDLLALAGQARYDIATAARLIQWIGEPAEAIRRLAAATIPGGCVVVLDYNHALNSWSPEPPVEFRRFWESFLAWRTANGWDNMIGDHLEPLFKTAGLTGVRTYVDDELAQTGDPGFSEASALWLQVVQSLGPTVVPNATERLHVENVYSEYIATRLETQRLCMRTVVGWR